MKFFMMFFEAADFWSAAFFHGIQSF